MLIMGAMVFMKQHLLDRELLGLLRTSEQSFQNLRRLQAQLVQSEKLASLGQLVGGAAHELNNPLTAILGYSELLTETPLSTEQQALAKKIAQQVRRTKTLVSSLLSFAKTSSFREVFIGPEFPDPYSRKALSAANANRQRSVANDLAKFYL